jgi:hypothetical protein
MEYRSTGVMESWNIGNNFVGMAQSASTPKEMNVGEPHCGLPQQVATLERPAFFLPGRDFCASRRNASARRHGRSPT